MIDFRIKISLTSRPSGLKEIFSLLPVSHQFFTVEQLEFIVWGDPIIQDDFLNDLKKNPSVDFIINHLYGHYYFVLLNKASGEICVGNSLFSILPVYYSQTDDNLIISNNQFMKSGNSSVDNFNKRFLLENILFNYPLFNQSCISGTLLLPANHYLKISNKKIRIQQHTAIEDYFTISPMSRKKSAEQVAEQFIQSVEKYFPSEPYISALTGGLDGRTLISCGLFYKKEFSTYSFGSSDSKDVQIARKLSAMAGITFHDILLNEEYVGNSSLTEGLSFIKGAGGTASFSRAHYQHAVKQLAIKTRYLITGNFGSEVFRAAHIAGVVISPNLYRLLLAKDYDDAIAQIENAPEWQWIERASFSEAWESLKEEIRSLPCFDPYYKKLTKNQQFYKIVFDEVFRKYFGAEMVNQYQYLINRTPFLDIDFLKNILGTRWAGVHSDFFTHNPFKRFKGQVIYAHIIKNTFPSFGEQLLDKGYKPSDVFSLQGNINIAFSKLNKKIVKKQKATDPFAVNASFRNNKAFWKALPIDTSLFNEKNILEAINIGGQRDSLFIALSQAWFYYENFRNNATVPNY